MLAPLQCQTKYRGGLKFASPPGIGLKNNYLVGRNIRLQTKNSFLSPDKKLRPIKVKVSLLEVQKNLAGQ